MLTYAMNQRDDKSKYYYLYSAIKEDILSGTLKKNEKLPSKRSLAEHLGISLITVETAYQMLKDEGYIESRERSGYFVTELKLLRKRVNVEKELQLLEHGERKQLQFLEAKRDKHVSDDALENRTSSFLPESNGVVQKEKSLFPESVYFKTIRSVLNDYSSQLLEKSPNEGCAILRNAIAKYLLRYRGIFAQPEQIIIGSGAEHLYSTVVRMFGNDKVYGLESPSYKQIRMVYEGMGAKCEMLQMGKEGIFSTELERTTADILHVTPFHSYPSGVTATVRKRQEYLEWAKIGERIVIEDDFDSEFFMPGKPIDTLYMSDDNQSVIYMNTFSKSLSPSIRIGYMILPEKYLELYRATAGDFSCTVPVLDQYVLAEFMDKGHFEQHLSRVRRYRENISEQKIMQNKDEKFAPVTSKIDELLKKGTIIVAIDGGSGSGKTTMAEYLQEKYDCTVFHMDDFFLRPEQRTRERCEEIGGNVDRERFLEEVLIPLSKKQQISYRRFDCATFELEKEVSICPKKLIIVEGVYSMHPDLAEYYDFSVFLEVEPKVQRERIKKRNSVKKVERYYKEWIPLENAYFQKMHVKDRCEMSILISD